MSEFNNSNFKTSILLRFARLMKTYLFLEIQWFFSKGRGSHWEQKVHVILRHLVAGALVFCAGLTVKAAPLLIDNAKALTALATSGKHRVSLTPLSIERGCGPSGCAAYIDDIVIAQDTGQIRAKGRRIRTVTHAFGAPNADWTPDAAYRITLSNGKAWGLCTEHSHTGAGRSGNLQRWYSIVLLPKNEMFTSGTAHRFIGYWNGCENLIDGQTKEETLLYVIERRRQGGELQGNFWTCGMKSCRSTLDTRPIREQTGSETGAIVIGK